MSVEIVVPTRECLLSNFILLRITLKATAAATHCGGCAAKKTRTDRNLTGIRCEHMQLFRLPSSTHAKQLKYNRCKIIATILLNKIFFSYYKRTA